MASDLIRGQIRLASRQRAKTTYRATAKSPGEFSGAFAFEVMRPSGSGPHPHHEAVEAQFSHLHPSQGFVAIGRQARVHLAEVRIALRKVRIDLARGVVAGFQHFLRKWL